MDLSSRQFALAFRHLLPLSKLSRTTLIVACSGGVDSMVLLDLMRELCGRKGATERLLVCHFNHQQRSALEHARDLTLIEEYCRDHGLKLHTEKLALKTGASENAMRAARYRALAALAATQPRPVLVLTAHHADDQLETYLLKLLRGVHPDSLKAIARRSRRRVGEQTFTLGRPLLDYHKSALRELAIARSLSWNEDLTNTTLSTTRNRIRQELLPLLNAMRTRASKHLLEFFSTLASQNRASAPRAESSREIARKLRTPDGYSACAADFASLKAAIDVLLDEQSSRTTRAHWETLKRQLELRAQTRSGSGPEKRVQFPGGHCLKLRGNRLFWIRT